MRNIAIHLFLHLVVLSLALGQNSLSQLVRKGRALESVGKYHECIELLQVSDAHLIPKRFKHIEQLEAAILYTICQYQIEEIQAAKQRLDQLWTLVTTKRAIATPLGMELGYYQTWMLEETESSKVSKALAEKLLSHEASKINPRIAARLHDFLGIYLGRDQDIPAARQSFQRALAIRQNELDADPREIVQSHIRLFEYHQTSGHADSALIECQALQTAALQTDNPILKGYASNAFALFYQSKKEYDRSLIYFREADRYFAERFDSNHWDRIQVLEEIATIHRKNGRVALSKELFNQCLRRLGLKGENALPQQLGRLYHNTSLNYLTEEGLDTAQLLLEKSIQFLAPIQHRKVGIDQLVYGYRSSLALVYYYQKDFPATEAAYSRQIADGIQQFGPSSDLLIVPYTNLGVTYADQELKAKADSCYQLGLQAAGVELHAENPFRKVSSIPTTNDLLWNWADNLHRAAYLTDEPTREKTEAAAFAYNLFISWIDYLRNSYQTQKSKEHLAKENRLVYQRAVMDNITLYFEHGLPQAFEGAFRASERNRGQLLLDQIQGDLPLQFSMLPSGIQSNIDSLASLARATSVERYLMQQRFDPNRTKLDALLKEEERHNKNYWMALEELRKDYPQYYNLKYQSKAVKVSELQESLQEEGACLLEYFSSEKSHWGFLITPDTTIVELLGMIPALRDSVYRFREAIVSPFIKYRHVPLKQQEKLWEFDRISYWLYQILIEKFQPYLTEEVILVPGSFLDSLPFEALVTTPVQVSGNFRNYDFFGAQKKISYAPSATIWWNEHGRDLAPSPNGALLFAPDYKGKLLEWQLDEGTPKRIKLSPLRHNLSVATDLHKILGGTLLSGSQASKHQFINLAPKSRLIHFSGHAGSDGYLAFSDDTGQVDSTLLFIEEIYNVRIPADLFVFAACESISGKYQDGEGLINLSRALSFAGVKSIISTLWPVQEAATATFMRHFHTKLSTGARKDRALQYAKQQMKKSLKFDSPYYWAGFVISGNMSPVCE